MWCVARQKRKYFQGFREFLAENHSIRNGQTLFATALELWQSEDTLGAPWKVHEEEALLCGDSLRRLPIIKIRLGGGKRGRG